MLIVLEQAKPHFDRWWVTGGFEDFLQAAKTWLARHVACGDDAQTVEEKVGVDDVRRVWCYCECGHRVVIIGPQDGRPMQPLFPRVH